MRHNANYVAHVQKPFVRKLENDALYRLIIHKVFMLPRSSPEVLVHFPIPFNGDKCVFRLLVSHPRKIFLVILMQVRMQVVCKV